MTTSSDFEGRILNRQPPNCTSLSTAKFLISGMFTISRLIGFSQFMVFMILRVIIGGSLGGRLYGDDPDSVTCYLVYNESGSSFGKTEVPDYHHVLLTSEDIEQEDIKMNCLMKTYSYVSPLHLWAIGLLTVLLPWILLIPWTPLRYDQEHVTCPWIDKQWTCLTIYIVRFLRACMRFLLEFASFIITPILYGRGIPEKVFCYDDRVQCTIDLYMEKSYFVWLLTIINAVACSLTVAELVDMCRHGESYEGERSIYKPAKKFSSKKSASANSDRNNSKRKKTYRFLSVPANMNGMYDGNQYPNNNKYEESPIFSGHQSHKKRLARTRAEDTTTKSKFRGRKTYCETDVVITLASIKENKCDQQPTDQKLQMTEIKETTSEDKENLASMQVTSKGITSKVDDKN